MQAGTAIMWKGALPARKVMKAADLVVEGEGAGPSCECLEAWIKLTGGHSLFLQFKNTATRMLELE